MPPAVLDSEPDVELVFVLLGGLQSSWLVTAEDDERRPRVPVAPVATRLTDVLCARISRDGLCSRDLTLVLRFACAGLL